MGREDRWRHAGRIGRLRVPVGVRSEVGVGEADAAPLTRLMMRHPNAFLLALLPPFLLAAPAAALLCLREMIPCPTRNGTRASRKKSRCVARDGVTLRVTSLYKSRTRARVEIIVRNRDTDRHGVTLRSAGGQTLWGVIRVVRFKLPNAAKNGRELPEKAHHPARGIPAG